MTEKKTQRQWTLQELAILTHSELVGDPDFVIFGVADLETALTSDASFFSNPRYQQAMNRSKAGVIFVAKGTTLDAKKNYLVSENPSRAFQQLIDTFYPPCASPSGFKGVHSTAVIHESAKLVEHVTVGPYAVIDEEVTIGANTFIGAGVYIGPHSTVGSSCILHPRVTIRENCHLGNSVIIQPGAVIGSCGFGYTTDNKGVHTKLNQVGDVIIEDHVEIGANATIDRARFKSTRIGLGTKIDNLVQIAHGVTVGLHNIIVAQTAIAGSSSTGRNVVLGGHVAVAGHLHLSDQVMVAGKSGVTKSLKTGKYGGIPAVPIDEYNRTHVLLRNIEKIIARINLLEKQILSQ